MAFRPVSKSRAVPVYVLTGFLGSGKTTLLNHLVSDESFSSAAVVINELGEVPLDAAHLERTDGVVTLANGCICCIAQGDIEVSLSQLHMRGQGSDQEKFSHLLIETSGLADPSSLIEPLLANPVLSRCFELVAIVTLVDSVHAAGHLARHWEAQRQVAVADAVVVTKQDMPGAESLDATSRRVAGLNSRARIFSVDDVRNHPRKFLVDEMASLDAQARSKAAERTGREVSHSHERVRNGDGSERDHHHSEISSFQIAVDEPIAWERFETWFRRLRIERGNELLRFKAVINCAGDGRPIGVHGVHHVQHPPIVLSKWPDADGRSVLFFVTQDLHRDEVERSFRSECLLTPS